MIRPQELGSVTLPVTLTGTNFTGRPYTVTLEGNSSPMVNEDIVAAIQVCLDRGAPRYGVRGAKKKPLSLRLVLVSYKPSQPSPMRSVIKSGWASIAPRVAELGIARFEDSLATLSHMATLGAVSDSDRARGVVSSLTQQTDLRQFFEVLNRVIWSHSGVSMRDLTRVKWESQWGELFPPSRQEEVFPLRQRVAPKDAKVETRRVLQRAEVSRKTEYTLKGAEEKITSMAKRREQAVAYCLRRLKHLTPAEAEGAREHLAAISRYSKEIQEVVLGMDEHAEALSALFRPTSPKEGEA